MSNIIIHLKAFHDWVEAPPFPGALTRLDMKGNTLTRVRQQGQTHTTVAIPETQLLSLAQHYDSLGIPKDRWKVIAWLLEEKVMPHHAPQDDWISIIVDGEVEVTKKLNSYFGLQHE